MSKSAHKILTTAEILINQHSFTGIGVDLIRDQSGCSKTTMYTYFKNKQQLINEVLKQRDQNFRESLTEYVGTSQDLEAIKKIFDWHINWFQTDDFKGCLFVRAVAESNTEDLDIKNISIEHKIWLRGLIHHYADSISSNPAIGELIYLLIEGLMSRFLVEGFNPDIASQQRAFIIRSLE